MIENVRGKVENISGKHSHANTFLINILEIKSAERMTWRLEHQRLVLATIRTGQ